MNAGNKGLRPEQLSRGQQTSRTVQAVLRILLGAFLILAGTAHLTVARAEFLAQVLIDKAGVARYVHYGHNMSDIPRNEGLLALGDEINAAAGASPAA